MRISIFQEFTALRRAPEMKIFPGGDFLVANAFPPIGRKRRTDPFNPPPPDASPWHWLREPCHIRTWDVSDPNTVIMALVGRVKRTGIHVFEIDGKYYTRAYRHVVLGKDLSECTEYYRKHSRAWGCNGPYCHSRVALVPYDGEFEPALNESDYPE